MTDRDYADEEVKGIERYIPSTLSKTLLGMIVTVPFAVFAFVRGNSEWFPILKTPLEQTLGALLASESTALILLFCLVINLSVIIYQSKHRRISRYNTHHPLMSFRWLVSHLELIHWLIIGLISAICFYTGYYISSL